MLKILFAGTPDFATQALQKIVDQGHEVVSVLTQPDRRSGRGRKIQFSPVKILAEQNAIPVLQPTTLKDNAIQEQLKALGADLMVVVAYGQILPQTVLDIPRLGCWNIHGSLLPRWRGAAPIQRCIEAGDKQSGVCIMQMDAGLDTGDVLHRMTCQIGPQTTGGELHDQLAKMGAEALGYCLEHQQNLIAEPQPEQGVTYAHKLEKSESDLDFNLTAIELDRKIRAFNPWPVARAELGGEMIRIWEAELIEQQLGTAGKIVEATKKGIVVACSEGALSIQRLQRPGGKVIGAADWINARPGLAE